MSSREIFSRGLISGLTYTEMIHMTPSFILDMFAERVKYDYPMQAKKALGEAITGV